MSNDHLFYEREISPDQEQEYIENIVKKYRHEEPTEELLEKVYKELSHERYLGNIHIPFKLQLKKDATGTFPPFIEVLLDTRV